MDRTDRAFWGATALSLAVFGLLGPLERRVGMIGQDDLSTIWAGPRAILAGVDPYSPDGWQSAAVALGTQLPDTAVYGYPPWVALALLPLGALPLPLVSVSWLVASVGLSVMALRSALRALLPGRPLEHAVAPLALLLSWAGLLCTILGQWGGLLVAALFGVVLALRRGAPGIAAVLALAFLAKPQLFLLAAPAIAVHACWPDQGRRPASAGLRFLGVAAGLAAAIIGISWLVMPEWWPAWSGHVLGPRLQPDNDTIPSFLGVLLGPAGSAAAPLVAIGLVGGGLAFHPRSGGWLPVWLTLSVTLAPYSNSYDKILLIVPTLLAAGTLRERWPGRSRAVFIAGASVLLFVTPLMYAIALGRRSEALSPIAPLLVLAVVMWGVWPLRRESSTGEPRSVS